MSLVIIEFMFKNILVVPYAMSAFSSSRGPLLSVSRDDARARTKTTKTSPSSMFAQDADGEGTNPNCRKALAALVVWPLLAVGDDIYVSQIQPRLAEKGIETPNLPYVEPKPYGYSDDDSEQAPKNEN